MVERVVSADCADMTLSLCLVGVEPPHPPRGHAPGPPSLVASRLWPDVYFFWLLQQPALDCVRDDRVYQLCQLCWVWKRVAGAACEDQVACSDQGQGQGIRVCVCRYAALGALC